MRHIIAAVFLVFVFSAPSAAQLITQLDPSETYVPIIQFNTGPTVCFPDGFCVSERQGIPISALATTTQLNALTTRVDNLVTTLSTLGPQLQAFGARVTALENQIGAINNSLVTINSHLTSIDDDLSKALEGAALAAAVKDALPNAGDRFALRLNAAGAGGEFAGAVGFAASVAERTRIHVNYGRSESQNAVSGGVNLSFR